MTRLPGIVWRAGGGGDGVIRGAGRREVRFAVRGAARRRRALRPAARRARRARGPAARHSFRDGRRPARGTAFAAPPPGAAAPPRRRL